MTRIKQIFTQEIFTEQNFDNSRQILASEQPIHPSINNENLAVPLLVLYYVLLYEDYRLINLKTSILQCFSPDIPQSCSIRVGCQNFSSNA
ncbi:unnamed protein product [Allacma fusca]|uniref:Uncharacterized protein n=1 Tax=Allacma fusca TaxID=39272 RepID=A0A8J2PCH1_9HEXA|nr:unnamed protein product [Allacma fusca]